jgi:putative transposase
MGKKTDDGILNELLKGCERPEDLLADGGLMRHLKKALMQRMLGAELTEHLGSEAPAVQTNCGNEVSRKTLEREDGAFEIEVPRDRKRSFETRLIGKGQTRIDGLDERIIAMQAHDMSVRDIRV